MNIQNAKEALKQYFGYSSFRPMQEEIIQTVLDKNDALVLMPTGGGKSICYQIPGIILDGICVVISPLISLMKDQVESLKSNGVTAAFINSSLSESQQKDITTQALEGQLSLLYVSPERLLTRDFYYLLKQIKINLFAVDEAHCISAWGHDFRPEYTRLRFLKEQFTEVPIMALTATADKITRKDIGDQLALNEASVFISSFDRPNLSLSVVPGRNRFKEIVDFIDQKPGQSGIIYCLSRKSTESLASKLEAQGYTAAHYHAGMPPAERSRVQEEFIKDNIPIICATVAFGMGIDKPNVRWVIHYNLPKNMESYYQEIGRAGRDGLKSDTLLFYSFADVMTLRSFVEENKNNKVELLKLERIQQYAESLICRRKILLNYFSENMTEDCGNCDVCKNPPQQFDGTLIAQKALSAIARLKESVATGILIDVLRGSGKKEILEKGYNQIKTYGAGADISYFDWQQLILQLINMGLLEVAYQEGQALKLTEASKSVLFDKKQVMLVHLSEMKDSAASAPKTKKKSKEELLQEELFESLRVLRKDLADAEGVPPYVVFNDVSLKEMAADRPYTPAAFQNVSGVGTLKNEKYGKFFLDEIHEFIWKKVIDEEIKVARSTQVITYCMYKQGVSVDDIAEKRKIKAVTVYTHLGQLYENGLSVDIKEFVTQKEIDRIRDAIKRSGNSESLKIIFESLEGELDYNKIRMGISYYNKHLKAV